MIIQFSQIGCGVTTVHNNMILHTKGISSLDVSSSPSRSLHAKGKGRKRNV